MLNYNDLDLCMVIFALWKFLLVFFWYWCGRNLTQSLKFHPDCYFFFCYSSQWNFLIIYLFLYTKFQIPNIYSSIPIIISFTSFMLLSVLFFCSLNVKWFMENLDYVCIFFSSYRLTRAFLWSNKKNIKVYYILLSISRYMTYEYLSKLTSIYVKIFRSHRNELFNIHRLVRWIFYQIFSNCVMLKNCNRLIGKTDVYAIHLKCVVYFITLKQIKVPNSTNKSSLKNISNSQRSSIEPFEAIHDCKNIYNAHITVEQFWKLNYTKYLNLRSFFKLLLDYKLNWTKNISTFHKQYKNQTPPNHTKNKNIQNWSVTPLGSS